MFYLMYCINFHYLFYFILYFKFFKWENVGIIRTLRSKFLNIVLYIPINLIFSHQEHIYYDYKFNINEIIITIYYFITKNLEKIE